MVGTTHVNSNLGRVSFDKITVASYNSGEATTSDKTVINVEKCSSLSVKTLTTMYKRYGRIYGDNILLYENTGNATETTNPLTITINKTFDISAYNTVTFLSYMASDIGFGFVSFGEVEIK